MRIEDPEALDAIRERLRVVAHLEQTLVDLSQRRYDAAWDRIEKEIPDLRPAERAYRFDIETGEAVDTGPWEGVRGYTRWPL